MIDESSQTPDTEPFSRPLCGVRDERRRGRRKPPKTLEEAHAMVQAIGKRRVENGRWVRIWQLVKRGVYLLALVGVFVLYYLIEKINEAISLAGPGF